jgi:hypothetical protein
MLITFLVFVVYGVRHGQQHPPLPAALAACPGLAQKVIRSGLCSAERRSGVDEALIMKALWRIGSKSLVEYGAAFIESVWRIKTDTLLGIINDGLLVRCTKYNL